MKQCERIEWRDGIQHNAETLADALTNKNGLSAQNAAYVCAIAAGILATRVQMGADDYAIFVDTLSSLAPEIAAEAMGEVAGRA